MSIRLEKIKSEFWDYQATVSEDGIIAKILRVIERPPSIRIDLLTDDEHETLNTYETIGFFKPGIYPKIALAWLRSANPREMRVVSTKPEVDIAWHKVGQAQLWYSTMSKVCVLWECLAFGDMKPRVKEFWEWMLKYCESLGMEKIYTHDRDPAYDDNYKIFLESLGFELVRERTMHWVRERTMSALEKYDYRGCGNCPLRGLSEEIQYGACVKEYHVDLRVKVTRPILWEVAWTGRSALVFKVGDVVEVEGVAKDGILYCCSGESTLHPGVKDYIDLNAIEILDAGSNPAL